MADTQNSGPAGAPDVPPMPASGRPYRKRGGIGAGVLLIALGVVFLIVQFMPGASLAQLWPLFVILVGAVQMVTPDSRDGWGISHVMDGIGVVIIGLVLLGNTTGFISWGVWWTVLTLWPVLLVAMGLSIIARAVGQSWLRILSPIVIWLAFAYAVATSLTGAGGLTPIAPAIVPGGQPFSVSAPLGETRTANLNFDSGAGDIALAGASGSELITAQGTSAFGTPRLVVRNAGTRADVALGADEGKSVFVGPGVAAGRVDVGLAEDVDWNATLQTGASSLSADFTHVRLSGLTLKTGASSATLKLGDVPDGDTKVPVVVKAGVSSVDVSLPGSAQARVVSRSGLAAVDVGSGLVRQADGSWQTPGYGSASKAYDIDIEAGVGSVSVRQR